jgi:hypothetical protein
MAKLDRRQMLTAVAAATVGLPLAEAADGPTPSRKLKVVVAGAHPDDPELSAGGTIARYTDLGHEVVCLYLTRGEMGVLKDTQGDRCHPHGRVREGLRHPQGPSDVCRPDGCQHRGQPSSL